MPFTILGLFDDSAAAQKAADALQKQINSIAMWHANHPFKSKKLFKNGVMVKLSPPEKALAQDYALDWAHGHDWLAVDDAKEAADVVSVLDAVVFLTGGETDVDPQPLDALMAAHGAQTVLIDTEDTALTVTLRAQANADRSLSTTRTILSTYQQGIAPAPWAAYAGDTLHENADDLAALEPIYLQQLQAVAALEDAGIADEDAFAQALNAQLAALPDLDLDDAAWVDGLRSATHFEWDTLEADDLTLTLTGVTFAEIASGLPALIAWVQSVGFNTVEWSLEGA